eukprot:CAMPEP_0113308882 /NCGR_PEP_ID=MMETSP0010_2-20120614/7157_1 /TAXON_ID=216773 ORGANISM="Corethron hystrix, Strain 308" /NCGR_SAMPLE_ID=MMETSP0010_2 /ASSEMBLY_ACC=CAM_ASM_000155 /LENGTH=564 /DNA_ID=CAMNT_0000164041 /DNA_START=312 /DNA_END=2006 /DNA_ORIENTATION=- /assembly_acc=CAM_ASM_000155
MTPVQAATITPFLTNKDVLVQAVTGSGKTIAYLLPLFAMLFRRAHPLTKHQTGALVILPTRELAAQVHSVASVLANATHFPQPNLLVGGTTVSDDFTSLSFCPHILIGTPGRLEDILVRHSGVVDMSELEVLVLDEADKLLDMGFRASVEHIIEVCPKHRRTGLFSATASGIRGLKAGMRNPVQIDVTVRGKSDKGKDSATPLTLTNFYYVCPLELKLVSLISFLRARRQSTTIVFFLTCASVEFYSQILTRTSLLKGKDGSSFLHIEPLHGRMVQKRRIHALARFRELGGALLCTDVAARGLDVSGIEWIVQFDPPTDPKSYVHRVGRTARAGRNGSSIVFLRRQEEAYIDFLRGRNVSLTEFKEELGVIIDTDIDTEVKKLVMTDRDVLEKGTKAYTSYIRAYKEHRCNFIFRFASIDLGSLATSLYLLRLPKMPELREKYLNLKHFSPAGPEIDIHAIPFLDKSREAARQKRLAAELAAGGKNAKQIKAERHAAERAKRLEERRKMDESKGRNPDKKRGKQQRIFDEWDELAKEERLHKKLKRGKISQTEFDNLMYGGTLA